MLKRWKARMEARGEALSIDKLAPVPPPADDNGLAQVIWAAGQLGSFPSDLQPPAAKYLAAGRCVVITKLNEWPRPAKNTNTTVTWVSVAEALALAEPGIQAAIEALQSPAFYVNLNYHAGFNMPMKHLSREKALSQVLSAAVLHDIHQGQMDAAFANLQALLAIPNVQKDEPVIISQLVRIAIMHIGFTATWQALQRDGWSDEQLAALQETWSAHEFLRAMDKALCMERAMAVAELEKFRNSGESLTDMFAAPGAAAAPTPSLLSWDWVAKMFNPVQLFTPLWKFAWSKQDELHHCQRMQATLEGHRRALSSKAGTIAIADAEHGEADWTGSPYDRVRFLMSRMILAALAKTMQRAWLAQTTVEIARTAIAIKRYELRHGKLPCTLQALVPEFLAEHPVDYMDGKPLRYCLESETKFLLYSVGLDGRDGGGDATSTLGRNLSYQNTHDTVWPQPASEAETAIWKVRP